MSSFVSVKGPSMTVRLVPENLTRAQHCRAEFYAQGHGWVPVDPADVRKVVLEEPPGKLTLNDPKVEAARKRLFGSWEMNWLAYSYAHDVQLPGGKAVKIPYFMYPNGETAEGRLSGAASRADIRRFPSASKKETPPTVPGGNDRRHHVDTESCDGKNIGRGPHG